MKPLNLILFFALFSTYTQVAQVGIGTTTPNASLEIQASNVASPANTDGLLIPKVDEFPATDPAAAQDGMLLYLTGNGSVSKGFYFWNNNSSSWDQLAGSTVDQVNDLFDGKADPTGSSVFIGVNAGLNDDDTNNFNTAMGFEAMMQTTFGGGNTAMGYQSLNLNTTGIANTAHGTWSLRDNTTGQFNTALGLHALLVNTTGNANTAVGAHAIRDNTMGLGNTALGQYALQDNTTGSDNVALGFNAGALTIGDNNVFIGRDAGSSGSDTKSGSVFIGFQAGYNEANSNRLYIENSNSTTPLLYGEFDNDFLRINGDAEIEKSTDAGLAVVTPFGFESSLKLFERGTSGDYGFEFEYDGSPDKLYLWSRRFAGNEGIRMTWLKDGRVGIGTTSPYAKLDLEASNSAAPSTTDGFLVPRIDAFPATNPGANQNGMLVFLNTDNSFYYWNNSTTSWVNIVSASSAVGSINDLSDGSIPDVDIDPLTGSYVFTAANVLELRFPNAIGAELIVRFDNMPVLPPTFSIPSLDLIPYDPVADVNADVTYLDDPGDSSSSSGVLQEFIGVHTAQGGKYTPYCEILVASASIVPTPARAKTFTASEEVCVDCIPEQPAPVLCEAAYEDYIAFLNTQMTAYVNTPLLTAFDPADPLNPEYLADKAYFCGSYLQYAVAPYTHLMLGLGIADTSGGIADPAAHPLFVSIGQFSSTDLGQAYSGLIGIIDEYIAYVNDPLITDPVVWTAYADTYVAAHPELCLPAPFEILLPIDEDPQTDCHEFEFAVTEAYLQDAYANHIENLKQSFKADYINAAMESVVEQFTVNYNDKEYQYTLYYYDQAGNLTQTVPPAGVDRFELSGADAAKKSDIATARAANTENIDALPNHTLNTEYKYNSLNQLVWQKTPDGGVSRFAYDDLGRIIASQNDKQNPSFSSVAITPLAPNTFIISEDGKQLERTSGGWAMAVGDQTIYGDAQLSRTLRGDNLDEHRAVSLGWSYEGFNPQATPLHAQMDYGFYTYFNSNLQQYLIVIYVQGQSQYIPAAERTFAFGDTLTIKRIDGVVYFYKNDTLLRSNTETKPTEGLQLDIVAAGTGRRIYDLELVAFDTADASVGSEKERFSYTEYDGLGRIVEAGELYTPYGQYTISNQGRLIDNTTATAVNGFPTGPTKTEVTRTFYDTGVDIPDTAGDLITNSDQLFYAPNVLTQRNRVTGVLYYDRVTTGSALFNNAIFYNYDIHGNVKELVNYYNDLKANGTNNRHIKRVVYNYDLISGNVLEVTYQPDAADQFIHKYSYDADNRITAVQTSRDGRIWQQDASYTYYEHGPLARTELGAHGVQGQDYIYTLQGWLKSVNGEYINNPLNDFGQDGHSGSMVARDAFGYSLGYFNGDYTPRGGFVSGANPFGLSEDLSASGMSLYNGNIRQMTTSIRDLDGSFLPAQVNTYSYDQLNRIKGMTSLSKTSDVDTDPVSVSISSSYSFDGNGNLQSLVRNSFDAPSTTVSAMDDFTYHYKSGTNQLLLVTDAVGTSGVSSDLEDQMAGLGYASGTAFVESNTAMHNYVYDEIGQLLQDKTERLKIFWRVDGKVARVEQYNNSSFDKLEETILFEYNGLGNRIVKTQLDHINKTALNTRYARDAQGNVLSVFETSSSLADYENQKFASYTTKEFHLYGSSRLGIENTALNNLTAGYLGLDSGSSLALEMGGQRYGSWQLASLDNETQHTPVNGEFSFEAILTQPLALNDSIKVVEFNFINTEVGISTTSDRLNTFALYLKNEANSYKPTVVLTSHTDGVQRELTTFKLMGGLDPIALASQGVSFAFDSNLTPQLQDATFTVDGQSYSVGSGVQITQETTTTQDAALAQASVLGGAYSPALQFKNLYYRFTTSYGVLEDTFVLGEASGDPESNAKVTMTLSSNDNPWTPSKFVDAVVQYTHFNTTGDKRYELSNHLGNVLSVISDKKIPILGTSSLDYFEPEVKAFNDYYPYGMLVPGRHGNSSDYRYGFNGMEADDELMGEGNSYDFGERFYNNRLGRFFSVDPMSKEFAWYSPFLFAGNTPIMAGDAQGLYPIVRGGKIVGYVIEAGQGPSQIALDINNPETQKEYGYTLQKQVDWTEVVSQNEKYYIKAGDWGNSDMYDADNPVYRNLNSNKDEVLTLAFNDVKTENTTKDIIDPSVPEGTKLKFSLRTAAEAVSVQYGEWSVSAPNDAQLGFWNRKYKSPYGLSGAPGVGGDVGFFKEVNFVVNVQKELDGNSLKEALSSPNVSQIDVVTGGSLVWGGYIRGWKDLGDKETWIGTQRMTETIFSGWGKGGGLAAGIGLEFPDVLSLEVVPLTRGDSTEIATKDLKIPEGERKSYLESIKKDK